MSEQKPEKTSRGRFRLGLLPKIIIAMGLGILLGLWAPLWGARVAETFAALFGTFLKFCIPLIIVGFVAPAIADVGGRGGRMLVFTALLAYAATICAGLFSFFTSDWLFPSMVQVGAFEAVDNSGVPEVSPFFTIDMPPLASVTSSLIIAFILGLGASTLQEKTMGSLLTEFKEIVSQVIRGAIIPLLPLYILCIFFGMTFSGQVSAILAAFAKIIAIIFAMHVLLLVFQYCIASFFARPPVSHNPLKMLWTMMPAYFTALGTQSSAATIPVTLQRATALGVDPDVAGFTVPLCATIHMSGSTLKIVACALALMLMRDIPYDFPLFMGFIAMLGVSIIAAPGVPGGSIMASLGILSSILGFTEADNALMIALYIAMDSFGTACNVTGDGALAVIVNRFFVRRQVLAEH